MLRTPRADDDVIKDGALVVVYERHDSMRAVYVAADKTHQNRFGMFDMKVCGLYVVIASSGGRGGAGKGLACALHHPIGTIGLGWQAIRLHCPGQKHPRLDIPAASHTRALVTHGSFSYPNLVCGRQLAHLHYAAAQAWMHRCVGWCGWFGGCTGACHFVCMYVCIASVPVLWTAPSG